jgi:hypothetical protein
LKFINFKRRKMGIENSTGEQEDQSE